MVFVLTLSGLHPLFSRNNYLASCGIFLAVVKGLRGWSNIWMDGFTPQEMLPSLPSSPRPLPSLLLLGVEGGHITGNRIYDTVTFFSHEHRE